MSAVVTKFAGRHFRSYLEAQWAAFFDNAGIEWEYEPESPFKGWWPDFLIRGIHLNDEKYSAYAEVKPVAFSPISIDPAFDKALHDRWTLLLGGSPCEDYIGFLACKREGECKTIAVRLTDLGLQCCAITDRPEYGCFAQRSFERAGDSLGAVGFHAAINKIIEAYTGQKLMQDNAGSPVRENRESTA